ncbi:hypothetical protein ABZ801_25885 [Actinomadura sp. NPDC047616]
MEILILGRPQCRCRSHWGMIADLLLGRGFVLRYSDAARFRLRA